MREQLAALAKLAEVDASTRNLELEIKEIPERINSMRLDVGRLETLLSREREQLTEAERLYTKELDEIREKGEQLARSKSKVAKAHNAKEVEAAERELESLRRATKEREDERDRLAKAIQQVQASLLEHEKEFSELKTIVAEEEEKSRAKLAELETQRSQVLVGRGDLTKKIAQDVLRRYDMIRERRGGMGVAAVVNGTCSGCRMALPAQQNIIIQRAETFEQCPNCIRILYVRETLLELLD